MSSVEELRIIRLYRAYNTTLQLCADRGYVVRHPAAVAAAMADPALYTLPGDSVNAAGSGGGLSYDWFLEHFVLSPQQVRAQLQQHTPSKHARTGDGSHANNEEDEKDGMDDELMQRAASGEWIAMRNAMRLACALPGAAAADTDADSPPKAELGSAEGGAVDDRKARKDRKRRADNALMVFFSAAPSLTVKEVQDFREKALERKAASMIVVANKVPAAVKRDVQELSGRLDPATGRELLRIQTFEEEALAFNITQHETVPPHRVLSHAEAAQFLADRTLSISQLPRLLESDPMAQYLGLVRGDIVCLTRPSKESGPYAMYRQVI